MSLRLALASCYARRGAPLPLVLDDVLVNFDAARAKAAAAVFRDFAAAGHQLLVFTCHEHISKLFRSLKVPVSQLPDNSRPGSGGRGRIARKKNRNAKNRRGLRVVEWIPVKRRMEDDQPHGKLSGRKKAMGRTRTGTVPRPNKLEWHRPLENRLES